MRAPIISPIRRVRPASIRSQPHQAGDNLRGAVLMSLSMLGFACNDAVMKFATQDMPLYQAIALRGVVMTLGILLIAWHEGGLRLYIQPAARWPMLLRLIGEAGSTLLFLNALTRMAIGDLAAIMQSLPLVVILAGAWFYGEPLGWRRLSAVLVGLLGVLIILRPGSGTCGIWALVGLGSMVMTVLRDLATRSFRSDVPSSTIAFYTSVGVSLAGLVLSIGQGWIMPDLWHLLLLTLAGGFLTVG